MTKYPLPCCRHHCGTVCRHSSIFSPSISVRSKGIKPRHTPLPMTSCWPVPCTRTISNIGTWTNAGNLCRHY
jgi:hypothetical protein